MKELRCLPCYAVAVMLSSTGSARIVETVDECKELYGEPASQRDHGCFTRLYFRYENMYRTRPDSMSCSS